MALEDNKVDLVLLLSNYLIDHSPSDQTMVVAGGFSEATIVKSSDPTLDLSMHEESDTRLILHCIHVHFCIILLICNKVYSTCSNNSL